MGYINGYGESACFWGILYIDHWYKTGQYIFVSADYLIDRGSTFSFGLYRIDAETGHISVYIPMGSSTYTVPGSYSSLGELMWSSGNDKLVFLTQGIDWEENPKVGFSLGILDIKNEKF